LTEVWLRIGAKLLTQGILRLPQDVALRGAMVADGDLVLTLDVPVVPEGADGMTPLYTRRTDIPDPIALTGMDWYRGDERLDVEPLGAADSPARAGSR
jgi:hypothetical protein